MPKLRQRLRVGRTLDAPPAVDVEVGEDAEEPGPEVRSGLERSPAPEGPRVCLLHQVLSFLASRDHPPRDAVDLVGKVESFLLEPDAVPCVLGESPRLRLRCRAAAARAGLDARTAIRGAAPAGAPRGRVGNFDRPGLVAPGRTSSPSG